MHSGFNALSEHPPKQKTSKTNRWLSTWTTSARMQGHFFWHNPKGRFQITCSETKENTIWTKRCIQIKDVVGKWLWLYSWCSCASLIVDQLGLWLFMTLLNYLLFCLLTDCLTTGDWSHIGFTAQPQPPSPPFLLPGNNKDPPNPVAARTKAPKQHPVITTMAVPGFIFGGWKSAPTKNPLKISSQTWGKSSKSRMGPLIWKAN